MCLRPQGETLDILVQLVFNPPPPHHFLDDQLALHLLPNELAVLAASFGTPKASCARRAEPLEEPFVRETTGLPNSKPFTARVTPDLPDLPGPSPQDSDPLTWWWPPGPSPFQLSLTLEHSEEPLDGTVKPAHLTIRA